jgi:hypothetical protein
MRMYNTHLFNHVSILISVLSVIEHKILILAFEKACNAVSTSLSSLGTLVPEYIFEGLEHGGGELVTPGGDLVIALRSPSCVSKL